MPWVTVFFDLPTASFDAAVAFWGQVTGYGLSPSRGADGEFATLLAGDGAGDGTGASRVDTLCLDVPPGGFDRELAFWAALTGQGTRPAPVPGYAYLDGPAGWPARLLLQRREQAGPGDPVSGHVDFGCTDLLALDRHVALGARVTATQQYWTVLNDPAGPSTAWSAATPADGNGRPTGRRCRRSGYASGRPPRPSRRRRR
jgi:Glyoxalase-like domain